MSYGQSIASGTLWAPGLREDVMNLSAPLETVISDIMITMSLKLTSYKGTRDLYPADI